MSESMLTARFLRNLLKITVMTITITITMRMTLMKMTMLMMRNLLRMVGDDEVGRSREQGVDLRKQKVFVGLNLRMRKKLLKISLMTKLTNLPESALLVLWGESTFRELASPLINLSNLSRQAS